MLRQNTLELSNPRVWLLYQSSTPATNTLEFVPSTETTTLSSLRDTVFSLMSSVIDVPPIPAPLMVMVVPTPYASPGFVNDTVPIPPVASRNTVKTAPVPSALVPVRLV